MKILINVFFIVVTVVNYDLYLRIYIYSLSNDISLIYVFKNYFCSLQFNTYFNFVMLSMCHFKRWDKNFMMFHYQFVLDPVLYIIRDEGNFECEMVIHNHNHNNNNVDDRRFINLDYRDNPPMLIIMNHNNWQSHFRSNDCHWRQRSTIKFTTSLDSQR